MSGYMEGFKLPCVKCCRFVNPEFFCPVEDIQAKRIQNKHSQWCLECIGRAINKYPCQECFEFFPKSGFSKKEFMKGMQRECIECSNGPPPELRDSNLLFKRTFECWNCGKKMNNHKKYTCTKCQRPTYCDKSCQKRHWIQHRTECEQQSKIAQRNGLIKNKTKRNKEHKQQNEANKQENKKQNSNKPKYCGICNKSVPEFEWKSHLNGKKHQKKCEKMQSK